MCVAGRGHRLVLSIDSWMEIVRSSLVLYCRAGCESDRPFGFQGTPPRDLGGVFAFWPTFRRDRESHPSWARSLPLGMSITGSCPLGPHGRDFGPKSLRVSRRGVPGLTGVRARERATGAQALRFIDDRWSCRRSHSSAGTPQEPSRRGCPQPRHRSGPQATDSSHTGLRCRSDGRSCDRRCCNPAGSA